MQDQTDSLSTIPAPDGSTQQMDQAIADGTAYHGLQPTVETVPYHAPPAQEHTEAVVSQPVKQAGPLLPESEPVQAAVAPSRRINRMTVAAVTLAVACVCAMIVAIFAVHDHRIS